MTSLRLRIHLLVAFCLASCCLFTFLCLRDFRQWQIGQLEIQRNLDRRAALLSFAERPFEIHAAHELRQKMKALFPPKTAPGSVRSFDSHHAAKFEEAVTHILRAHIQRDATLLRQRVEDLSRNEAVAFERMRSSNGELLRSSVRMLGGAIASPVLGLLFFLHVVRFRILRPLDRLSRRMKDFLVDRYSFQFAIPERNELGDMQRTFNSLAQQVINNRDELKRLDQAKSEFLNVASHELRTPITSIKGSLGLLSAGVMGAIDPACIRLVKIAEAETDRLIRLINDLLDLAKIEAGKLPLACDWIRWDEVLAKTAEGLLGLVHSAGVKIELEAPAGLEVFIDRDRVQQVLTNLISNSIKFSPLGGKVHISAQPDADRGLLIHVRDQGPGISLEDQKFLFEKFHQGTSSERPLLKGTGLGLAIAKALVEEHGGRIGVHSSLGAGAVFWFTLPQWRENENLSSGGETEQAA